MSAYIYLEGGASGRNSKDLTIRCQQAFRLLMERMGITSGRPRLVACGGRNAVYERFCIEHGAGKASYVGTWIDAEEPMADIEQAWRHLGEVTTVARWPRPAGAEDEQVLFMTTCSETWIVADRVTLRDHYKQLNENPLPAIPNLEHRSRQSVYQALLTATHACSNAYAKRATVFGSIRGVKSGGLATTSAELCSRGAHCERKALSHADRHD